VRGEGIFSSHGTMELCGSTPVIAEGMREIPMNHKGVEYTLTRSETPGFWRWQFRIGDLVRSGRTEARLALLAMRRVQLRIDRELKHATRQLTSCLGFARFSPRPSPLLTGAQAALDQVLYSCIC
jgi:hypothetical protein